MHKLPIKQRVQILNMLVEGSSIRATSRITGASTNTVMKLLRDAGAACAEYHDRRVRGINSPTIQCDEVWSFCYAKEKNASGIKGRPKWNGELQAGSVWTWTAIESDTKVIITWLVSPGRDQEPAAVFMCDLRERITGKPQIISDGLGSYLIGVKEAFDEGEVDYGQLIKEYGGYTAKGAYVPSMFVGAKRVAVMGEPEVSDIHTSYVERQNLTMRMCMKRFTRETNAFSKRIENHCHALALYFVWYNFCRAHSSLGKPYKGLGVTPAMAAGMEDAPKPLEWIIEMTDDAAGRN